MPRLGDKGQPFAPTPLIPFAPTPLLSLLSFPSPCRPQPGALFFLSGARWRPQRHPLLPEAMEGGDAVIPWPSFSGGEEVCAIVGVVGEDLSLCQVGASAPTGAQTRWSFPPLIFFSKFLSFLLDLGPSWCTREDCSLGKIPLWCR
jgi:hypothetical protein